MPAILRCIGQRQRALQALHQRGVPLRRHTQKLLLVQQRLGWTER